MTFIRVRYYVFPIERTRRNRSEHEGLLLAWLSSGRKIVAVVLSQEGKFIYRNMTDIKFIGSQDIRDFKPEPFKSPQSDLFSGGYLPTPDQK